MKNVNDSAPEIFVFVALPCEAKPLVAAWKLKKNTQIQAFVTYQNQNSVLTVSGLGKVAMAAAVAYTLARHPDVAQPLLLNLGVAGHRNLPLGSCVLADQIIDADSGRRFYPQLPFSVPCPTHALKTMSQADETYSDGYIRDMEASAFFETAVKFSSSELVHCLKVVSDNADSPLANITEDAVTNWIDGRLSVVADLIVALRELRAVIAVPDGRDCQGILSRFHFTASNAAKLQSLLNRWRLMNGVSVDLAKIDAKNAKDLIAQLEALVAEKQFYL
ncbi:hypothetical protein ACH518_05435 [Methylomonas sp. HW2-6]|uniref:5'-methylthioadenosine/S-adenosylhomocysteine nucleosidase family protein n=1 Tax=Methylomonas sp. HW2-6 TaxID=3376687 RepID=UPI00404245B3